MAHVGDDPFLFRHPITRQSDHFGRRVDARHVHSALYQEPRDRLASAAANVKHTAAAGQIISEGVDSNPNIPPPAAASRIPPRCASSIKVDD
jgi:hypothetical protein